MIRRHAGALLLALIGLLLPHICAAQEPFFIQPLPKSLAELRKAFSAEQIAVVIGAFGHGEPPPWTSLPALSTPIDLPSASPHPPSVR